jgi:cell division protein ZapA
MSEKLKIKLSIGSRVYPLTIEAHQEEGLRKAAKSIEAMIMQFERSYSVRDKQDVLAMCALQFASQVEQKTINKDVNNKVVEQKLKALNAILDAQLSL